MPGYEDEAQRLTLYLPGGLLDLAEDLAELANTPTIQEYCAKLLAQALEDERARLRVADAETKRGPLEGLRAIAGDPNYLAEWQDDQGSRQLERERNHELDPNAESKGWAADTALTVPVALEPTFVDPAEDEEPAPAQPSAPVEPGDHRPIVRVETRWSAEPVVAPPITPELIDGPPMDILWSHVDPSDHSGPGFLPTLRRGESIAAPAVAQLSRALDRLEDETRGAEVLDRRLAYALYRLAMESQVLLTEVWPGAFDEPTIEAIRAAQEAVERILSGQDVRPRDNPETQPGEIGS